MQASMREVVRGANGKCYVPIGKELKDFLRAEKSQVALLGL